MKLTPDNIEQYAEYAEVKAGEWFAEEIKKALAGKVGPEAVAKAVYAVVKKKAAEYGMKPEIETFIWSPEQSAAKGYSKGWRVSWESGPYEWGLQASMALIGTPGVLAEPYYSFDLNFYPN